MKTPLPPTALTGCCLLVLLVATGIPGIAQFDSLGINTTWREGSLLLENNTSLDGLIKYNDKLGMIKFRQGDGEEERSFSEKAILAMQFYDENTGVWRHFATFNVKEEESGWQGALLFEVLIEFENYALLTRLDRVDFSVRQRRDAWGNTKVGLEQFEKFCLVDEDGTATVVLAVSEFEGDKYALKGKLKPYLNIKAIEQYLGEDWDKFQQLVKSNKLDLKKRDYFVRAFRYLKQAIQEGY